MGHKLTEKGVEPDQFKGEAIKEMPSLSETVLPLRDLTIAKLDTVFYGLTRIETLSVQKRN